MLSMSLECGAAALSPPLPRHAFDAVLRVYGGAAYRLHESPCQADEAQQAIWPSMPPIAVFAAAREAAFASSPMMCLSPRQLSRGRVKSFRCPAASSSCELRLMRVAQRNLPRLSLFDSHFCLFDMRCHFLY